MSLAHSSQPTWKLWRKHKGLLLMLAPAVDSFWDLHPLCDSTVKMIAFFEMRLAGIRRHHRRLRAVLRIPVLDGLKVSPEVAKRSNNFDN